MTKLVIDKKKLKIMLIDDDNISSFIYKKVIETAGLADNQIYTFLHGTEALDHLENNLDNANEFPDLILLDINMPVMDGWGFLDSYAKKIWPKLKKKVVLSMLSSSSFKEDINKAYSYPQVNDYVSKPLTVSTLENLLTRHFVHV